MSSTRPDDWRKIYRSTPVGVGSSSSAAPPSYAPKETPAPEGIIIPVDSDYAPSSPDEAPLNDYEAGDKAPQAAPHPEAPDPKRPRHDDYDLKWVEQLEADARLEVASMDSSHGC